MASLGVKERYARLNSTGAPLDALNGTWRRNETDHCGFPHFLREALPGLDSGGGAEQTIALHLYYHSGVWQITSGIDGDVQMLAMCESDAAHPNTIDNGSWLLLKEPEARGGQPEFVPCSTFDFTTSGPNTPDRPFLVDEIGLDYFIREQPRTSVIWFECPRTGQVFHSGAKARGNSEKPGNRYCPLCHKCFSANNFKSQHMRSHQREEAPPAKHDPPPASPAAVAAMVPAPQQAYPVVGEAWPLAACAQLSPAVVVAQAILPVDQPAECGEGDEEGTYVGAEEQHLSCKDKTDAIRAEMGFGAELPMPAVVKQGFEMLEEDPPCAGLLRQVDALYARLFE